MEPLEHLWEMVRSEPRSLERRRELARALMANGDPLGEFLSLCLPTEEQLEKSRRADKAAGEPLRSFREREARADALLKTHGAEWFPNPPGDRSTLHWSALDGRGVPDWVSLVGKNSDHIALLEWWTARYPIRTLYVSMTDPLPLLAWMEGKGLLSKLETLNVSECTLTSAVVELFSRAAPGLLRLGLNKVKGLDGELVARLFTARAFEQTVRVGMSEMKLPADTLRALWSGVPALKELQLYGVELQDGRGSLPTHLHHGLETLTIQSGLREEHVLPMLSSLSARDLKTLELKKLYLGGGVLNALAMKHARGELEALHTLDLSENSIDGSSLEAFCQSPPPNLKVLRLDQNSLGPEGVATLAASPLPRQLEVLGIDRNELYGPEIEAVYQSDSEEPIAMAQRPLSLEEVRAKFGLPAGLQLK